MPNFLDIWIEVSALEEKETSFLELSSGKQVFVGHLARIKTIFTVSSRQPGE